MAQLIEIIFLCITAVLTITYAYLKFYVYNYWKRHGIPHEKPCIPLGNITVSCALDKVGLGDVLKESYEKFKQYAFHGFYIGFQPIIMINDPQLIRTIFVKEFVSFHSRGWYSNKKIDSLSNHLFLMNDYNDWHHIRSKLSPKFTPAKVKQTFSLIMEISNEMKDFCDTEIENNNLIDGTEISKRFTLDIICCLIYRYNPNSLKNLNNDFYRMSKRAFEWGNIKMVCGVFIPKILEFFRISYHHKEVIVFFTDIFKKLLNQQLKESIKNNDIMSTFIENVDYNTLENDKKLPNIIQKNSENNHPISVEDAAAHTFLLLLAGFDTASVTMAYCLYELTVNPEIMKKLQNEVDEVAKNSSNFTYENIGEMVYLDMVINETLRKYPPVQFFNRLCHKDFLIPGSNYTIPKGMRVVISSLGVLHNPEFFPDPTKFDPERYNKENPDNKRNFVDLSFGEGPRSCIGKKLGLMQLKLGLVILLHNYNITLKNNGNHVDHRNTGNFIQSVQDLKLFLERRKCK